MSRTLDQWAWTLGGGSISDGEPICRRWRLAAEALAALVREDYPNDLRLSEIARTWANGLTPEQIDALRSVEANLPTEAGLSFREQRADVGKEQGA